MSETTEKSVFTPGRENEGGDDYLTKLKRGFDLFNFFGFDTGPYSENSYMRAHVVRAREIDRDSRIPLTFVWKSLPGFNLQRLEPARHFARQVALDSLAEMVGTRRGAALTAKPDEELRSKIRLFKDIQAAREAAFEFTGKGKYGGKDVPARLGLGGSQDFTPGREKTHKRPKGYAPWRPQKKTTRLLFQVKQILAEYRDQPAPDRAADLLPDGGGLRLPEDGERCGLTQRVLGTGPAGGDD